MTTQLNTQQATRKFGKNKGQARLWIEGKLLLSNGWTKGKRYDRIVTDDHIMLVTNPEGKLKVAGSEGRPVLDISGKWMTEWQGNALEAGLTITERELLIVRLIT